jgi:hypothetical protein
MADREILVADTVAMIPQHIRISFHRRGGPFSASVGRVTEFWPILRASPEYFASDRRVLLTRANDKRSLLSEHFSRDSQEIPH